VLIYYLKVRIVPPPGSEALKVEVKVQKQGENHYQADNGSWLRKNDKGLWEMFLKGAPYELGVSFGELAQELGAEKEAAFVGEIKNRVPSPVYLNFLKYLVGWFNRDLDEYVPEAQLMEIYGASKYMSDNFDNISPKFHRALSYHAAHDIGHALQNMNLVVGCTSFATWNEQSENNKLLIGRNFDFYFGEAFAKDMILAFYKPDEGYQFMSVTWAIFSGVVSGMNEKGLTVTLNAAKSAIPTKGKTPVSLIARQILQHAATIEEAYTIARSFDSFVAESFLIGSKAEGKVGLIEKSPDTTALYLEEDGEMIVTNHFQSEALKHDPLNEEYKQEGVSTYRYERVNELIDSLAPMTPEKAAYILRNKQGLHGKDIGLANEKAVNQLIAHHSIIFSPEEMMVWVAAPPYQLGEYVAYDLNKIFKHPEGGFSYDTTATLPADPFLASGQYRSYEEFVAIKDRIQQYLFTGEGETLTSAEEKAFVQDNPNGFLTYYYLGDYWMAHEKWEKAAGYFETGLTKEIAKASERKHLENGLKTCREKMKND
jgi:isopenicillin-N N-acyltransferase like protein